MEKLWPKKSLETLLPHYKFYEQKGIKRDTLMFLQSGLCHEAEMNMRYAFPIFDRRGLIHGWSGRDITNQNSIKWKHVGSKKNWIYPVFVRNSEGRMPCLEAIKNKGEVILVESIGDMMRLWDFDIKNVVVTFGLDISSKLGTFIMSLGAKRIIIATNNDFESEINNGRLAALKMFLTLTKYVDFNKIIIALPFANDFGASSDEQIEQWKKRVENVNKEIVYKEVLKYIKQLDSKKITQHVKKIKKMIAYESEKNKVESF